MPCPTGSPPLSNQLDLTRFAVGGHAGGRTVLDLAAHRCGHRDGASLVNSGPKLVAGGAVILCDGDGDGDGDGSGDDDGEESSAR